MKTFRALLDQPLAAVHQPGRRAATEPVLGLHVLAGEVALGVQDRFRLAGGPDVKVMRQGSAASRSTAGAGSDS